MTRNRNNIDNIFRAWPWICGEDIMTIFEQFKLEGAEEYMDVKVSVIIPTYKRSEYLKRAIDSVLKQTYLNFEIIVVDDNEANSMFRFETEKQMLNYLDNNKVIYLKNKGNLGGSLARNQGILISSGEYITFLDDDDIYLPEKIEKQLFYMIKGNYELTFTDIRIHNSKDKLIDYRQHNYIKDFSKEELLKQHIMHHLTPTATYMFKKETIIKLGGFEDLEMGQEFMLMLKAIEEDVKIGYLSEAYVIQYIHRGERISVGSKKLEKENEMFEFKKKYFKYLSNRQRRYVKFRHFIVMCVVSKRSRMLANSMKYLVLAILTSPVDCVLEVILHFKKINKYRIIAKST